MRDTLPFLQRLGLDSDADARSIRRAYARELKLIDQEQDAAGFQELREAYDNALQWAAWRERQAGEADAAAPATDAATGAASAPNAEEPAAGATTGGASTPNAAEPAAGAVVPEAAAAAAAAAPIVPNYGVPRTPVTLGPAPELATPPLPHDDPTQLAAAVFAEFLAATTALLRQQHVQHPPQWQAALQHSLDDERLLNLTARIYFEAHIAQLLASGWQPGNEVLFVIAGKLFHWNEDRRRLQQLGRAGALVDQAIDERVIFDQLPESEQMIHRAAIVLLRKSDAPSDYQLRGDMPYVEKLMAYFPVWMSMMVDQDVVRQWRERAATLPPPKKSWLPKIDLGISPRMGWILFIVVLQLARVIFNHVDTPANIIPSSPAPFMPEFKPLPEYIRKEISAKIPVFPLKLGGGQHQAEFNVILDDQGNIYQQMMYRTSDNLSYDEAASKALRASQPFPPETPRKFQVTFTVPTGSSQ
ncbi:TonB C-terminal domain-containing protein [Duganella radicis]|uniref:TonB family protein n=1 Tax=Duganella radicis TaxID=551988 RepID=A0A6L6PRZ8_9BURK|nr:TonB C-terminal domain-containing protein [Duganella radicis]MTV41421.1 hypothetical protein [Duganella radicis]